MRYSHIRAYVLLRVGNVLPPEKIINIDRYLMLCKEGAKVSYDIYTGILKMFEDFPESSSNTKLSYDTSDKQLQSLRQRYSLDGIAGHGDDLSKSLNILSWLSSNTIHKGNYGNHIPNNSLDLLEYAFQQGAEHGINCRALSIILTECLLSIGIMARTIYIMPFSPYDSDNHVITHAFIKSLNKWILLDPTYNSYIMDDRNNILNIFETRNCLANQEKLLFNKEINYNGESWTDDAPYYVEYLAKDLFYFITKECSRFNAEGDNRTITISPRNFDVKKSSINNIEYRIRKYGGGENMQKWLENVKENKLLYASPEDLLETPRLG